MQAQSISITVTFTDEQAWVFAQFLKRVSVHEYRLNAIDDSEAYDMVEAGEVIRRALASQGYDPR